MRRRRKFSAAILAGGTSSRMGIDKGLLSLTGKPMIFYVIEACSIITDDVFVVVGKENLERYVEKLADSVEVVPDVDVGFKSPLVGAYTALSHRGEGHVLLLPCDTPLVKIAVLSFLVEVAEGWDAVVPRWPNGYIEPLVAVYDASKASLAAKCALDEGHRDMQSILGRINTLYVSTLIIKELDPELETFFNVNTLDDLKVAEEKLLKKAGQLP